MLREAKRCLGLYQGALLARTLRLAFALSCALTLSNCSKRVPPEAYQAVFESAPFSDPIGLKWDAALDPEAVKLIEARCSDDLGKGAGPFRTIVDGDTLFTSDVKLSFLKRTGAVNVSPCTARDSHGISYYFVRPSSAAFTVTRAPLQSYGWLPGSQAFTFELQLAKRKLRSITYVNEYQASPMGTPLQMLAVNFTYEPVSSTKLNNDQTFEGRAVTFLDPTDGRWKKANIELSDTGLGAVRW